MSGNGNLSVNLFNFGTLGSYSNGIQREPSGNQNVSTNHVGFVKMQETYIKLNKKIHRINERLIDPSVAEREPLCTKKAAIDAEIDRESKREYGNPNAIQCNPSSNFSVAIPFTLNQYM